MRLRTYWVPSVLHWVALVCKINPSEDYLVTMLGEPERRHWSCARLATDVTCDPEKQILWRKWREDLLHWIESETRRVVARTVFTVTCISSSEDENQENGNANTGCIEYTAVG